MTIYKSYINGKWVDSASGKTVENINPANIDDVIGTIEMANRAETRLAVEAAYNAFRAWKRTPAPARGRIVAKAARLMEERREELAAAITREVDDLLYTHPAVAHAAVIGVPDDLYGEEVAAFIVLKDGYTAVSPSVSSPRVSSPRVSSPRVSSPHVSKGSLDQHTTLLDPTAPTFQAETRPSGSVSDATHISPQHIIDFCKLHLADFKCPKTIHFVDDIPKGPTGKLLKRELAKLFAEARTK